MLAQDREIQQLIKNSPADQKAIIEAILMANRRDEIGITDDLIRDISTRRSRLFDIVHIDLSIDRSTTPLEISGAGTVLIAYDATDNNSNLSVSLDHAEGDSNRRFRMTRGKRLKLPYTKFFIYHSTQASKTMTLLRVFSLASIPMGVEDDSGESANSDLVTALGNSSTFSTGQVAVDTTVGGTTIIAANTSRKRVTIKVPVTASVPVFIRETAPTTSNGHCLDPADVITLNTTAAVKGIVSSGSVSVTYLEE